MLLAPPPPPPPAPPPPPPPTASLYMSFKKYGSIVSVRKRTHNFGHFRTASTPQIQIKSIALLPPDVQLHSVVIRCEFSLLPLRAADISSRESGSFLILNTSRNIFLYLFIYLIYFKGSSGCYCMHGFCKTLYITRNTCMQ
jgi:hypothetical protein